MIARKNFSGALMTALLLRFLIIMGDIWMLGIGLVSRFVFYMCVRGRWTWRCYCDVYNISQSPALVTALPFFMICRHCLAFAGVGDGGAIVFCNENIEFYGRI